MEATVSQFNGNVTVSFEILSAGGALFNFVFVANATNTNFTRSFEARNHSQNYILPFSLPEGEYRVFVYNIEENGLITSGVNYPAVTQQLMISPGMAMTTQATYILIMIFLL